MRAIGNDLSMDYDAIGPTVHLASRMEQLASPGTIRLTAATANLARFRRFRSLGQVPVKGLSQPIEASICRGRCGAHAPAGIGSRGLSPFVGRRTSAALDQAHELAAAGHGQSLPSLAIRGRQVPTLQSSSGG